MSTLGHVKYHVYVASKSRGVAEPSRPTGLSPFCLPRLYLLKPQGYCIGKCS